MRADAGRSGQAQFDRIACGNLKHRAGRRIERIRRAVFEDASAAAQTFKALIPNRHLDTPGEQHQAALPIRRQRKAQMLARSEANALEAHILPAGRGWGHFDDLAPLRRGFD
ncbi:hypothetical protein RF55_20418 [Lasius niger]|uniref:Uncharacterized protein n=1 Tax=Lasius niger TaxID=67767 RepID=A0A0J7MS15_LASNI|nr:hypothetical protein RF55_20418 [Lasius niger]